MLQQVVQGWGRVGRKDFSPFGEVFFRHAQTDDFVQPKTVLPSFPKPQSCRQNRNKDYPYDERAPGQEGAILSSVSCGVNDGRQRQSGEPRPAHAAPDAGLASLLGEGWATLFPEHRALLLAWPARRSG